MTTEETPVSTQAPALHKVRDGVITLEFQGESIAKSSSRKPGQARWVEFELFVTPRKQYVLSRIGMSVFYHAANCSTVSRNRLNAVNGAELSNIYIPCDECRPARINPEGVYPELPRYWAQHCETAEGVVDSLMKRDELGNWYLTHVARRLLAAAGEHDEAIQKTYLYTTID